MMFGGLILHAGQIFCSRCASNIIKGSRFGHNGMVRVCNLCLEKLAKVDSDEEDDRRSVVSSVNNSPFPAHQLGSDSLYLGLGHHPQSPFAASQLFGRTDEPFNLYSIAETQRPISGSDESGFASRPITPGDLFRSSNPLAEPFRDNPAPFRRGLTDEEKDPVNILNSFPTRDDLPTVNGVKPPVAFPATAPISVVDGKTSSVQFPTSSPDYHGPDSPRPGSRHRSRFNSHGDFEAATPFIRSRVQSRLDTLVVEEPGWRTRRESTA
jgi:1-phosphatidylinositol-3-phosphate 5-kinase